MLDMVEFNKANTQELKVLKSKVEGLIAHHGENGRYKEAILTNMIRKSLPGNYSVGNGFVVKSDDHGTGYQTSPQIDLIVYDGNYPVLFREGDFIIISPEAVHGIVEIKTNVTKEGFSKALERANEVGSFIYTGKSNKQQPFFNGIFSYEGRNLKNYTESKINTVVGSLKQHMNDEITRWRVVANEENKTDSSNFMVNHIAFGDSFFMKHHRAEKRFSFYKLDELAYSYFISNLVYTVSGEAMDNNIWLWFPVDKQNMNVAEITY